MRDWVDFAYIMVKALSVSGIVMVLGRHVPMAWWEGGVLSFGIMMLFGSTGTK
jgi:hypothetical protein